MVLPFSEILKINLAPDRTEITVASPQSEYLVKGQRNPNLERKQQVYEARTHFYWAYKLSIMEAYCI